VRESKLKVQVENVKLRNRPEADKSGGGECFFDRSLHSLRSVGITGGALGVTVGVRSVGMTGGAAMRSSVNGYNQFFCGLLAFMS